MKLSKLTSENLILLDAVFEDRLTAINHLADKIDQAGKLTDKQAFLDAVMLREEEGPTALGEYLAVPHGKSNAVTEPTFACAFLKQELQWKGIDGDEPVNMVFLLAIPSEQAGSTHIEVLTTLTSSLVEDEFREKLLAAQSTSEVMTLFGEDEVDQETQEVQVNLETHQQPVEMANDISSTAYPIVLGVGLVISVILFLLL